MAHRPEREPDYVTNRTAAVDALGLHYALAVCCVAAFLAVTSLADDDAKRSASPVLAKAAVPATNLHGSLACARGFGQPSS
jgi:hypothetical protein